MYTKYKNSEVIVCLIQRHINLFELFDSVYLFGSILKGAMEPEDIDLLLVYNEFSDILLRDIDKIRKTFEKLYNITFDLTVLSIKEEKEVNFIDKLCGNYLELKEN